MSRKNKAPDIHIRSGVLSCFNYKKKGLLHKEAYELSPIYWKCFRHGTNGNVLLQGYRSEVSHKDKPRVSMVVNGCTTELLPPLLKSKGIDYPGNDNYLGIQTAEDKIVFLKAEGRSQRDLWYKDILEALGDDPGKTTTKAMTSITEEHSTTQERPPMPSLDDKIDNDNRSLSTKAQGPRPGHSDVYHVPYEDYEPMRCSVSTDDDGISWPGTKPSPSTSTKHASPIISDAGDEDAFVSEPGDMDDDGYIFPTNLAMNISDVHSEGVEEPPSAETSHSSAKTAPLNGPRLPEAKPVPVILVAAEDRPAISSDFIESLKQAQESKTRSADSSPEKPRYTPLARRTKPLPPPLPDNLPKVVMPKELKQPTPEMKSATEETVSPPVKTPLKVPEGEQGRKSRRKPLKMPPPLPAGGNLKPKTFLGNSSSDRHETLPQLPPFPQARIRTNQGDSNTSSSETSPVKQPVAEANEKVYQLVRSFRSTQMSPDTKSIEIAKDLLEEKESLSVTVIKSMVYISGFRGELCTTELLIGDEVHRINGQAVTSAEDTHKYIHDHEGDTVTFSIKKIPHGVLSFISRAQEPSPDLKKLGLTLAGNEITKFDSEGLVARSGIPSRQVAPGITNGGELVNWALTQINMIPISANVTPAQVEDILSDSGNNLALVFHPTDFAAALVQ
ncbi:uncharacterized protein LOC129272348 [Lytechinus pictus]|uniref:uncharacterized protein LOC129272348 n=1 Tax=Lytechinus pictus TaxID=7653 RepID=UPI0030BA0940